MKTKLIASCLKTRLIIAITSFLLFNCILLFSQSQDIEKTISLLNDLESKATDKLIKLDKGYIRDGENAFNSRSFVRNDLTYVDLEGKIDSISKELFNIFKENDSLLSNYGVETSLIYFTVLVRRNVQESLHTTVFGLKEDKECQGDIIGDKLLLKYFNSITNITTHNKYKDERAIISALSDLAVQSACISTYQALLLSRSLINAFDELQVILIQKELSVLMPYISAACFNPFLLYFDVLKYLKDECVYFNWFQRNKNWLIQSVENGRNPTLYTKMWLYDRRTGLLIGYNHSIEKMTTNSVNLFELIESLTKIQNFGKGDCSLLEMIERGITTEFGYVCLASECKKYAENLELAPDLMRLVEINLGHSPDSSSVINYSHFCSAIGSLPPSLSNMCENISLSSTSDQRLINCLNTEVFKSNSSRHIATCTAEALSKCSNLVLPKDRLVDTRMMGVKLGIKCQLSQQVDESYDSEEMDDWLNVADKYNKKTKTENEYKKAADNYKSVADNYKNSTDLTFTVIINTISGGITRKSEPLELDGWVKVLKTEMERLEKKYIDASNDYDREKEAYEKKWGRKFDGSQNKCLEKECNDCSAMAQWMKNVQRCFTSQFDPDVPDPTGPLVYPEDIMKSKARLKCLRVNNIVSKPGLGNCWAKKCATNIYTNENCCNFSHTSASIGGKLGEFCDKIYCTDGNPIFAGGQCFCSNNVFITGMEYDIRKPISYRTILLNKNAGKL